MNQIIFAINIFITSLNDVILIETNNSNYKFFVKVMYKNHDVNILKTHEFVAIL